MNRKSMSISIVLLFISTLVIVGICLVVLMQSEDRETQIFSIPYQLDSVYGEEARLNFFINNIFEKSLVDFNPNNGKKAFIDKFNENLDKYIQRNSNENLAQIKSQVNEEHIILNNEKIEISFNLQLESKKIPGNEIGVVYHYDKRFEKVFK